MTKPGPTAPAPTKPMDDTMFDQLVGMIRIQCTAEEICNIIHMSPDTLNTRLVERGELNFSELYKKHQAEGNASLRRAQWKTAVGQDAKKETATAPAMPFIPPNPTMQIWLGKQNLEQSDKAEIQVDYSDKPTFNVTIPGLTKPAKKNGKANGVVSKI